MRYLVALLFFVIIGCSFSQGELEIADGVMWRLYGVQDSCIDITFFRKSIRGDLHIEFLEQGLLVSRWEKNSERHKYFYIDLCNATVSEIYDNEFPVYLRELMQSKKTHISYCLFSLIGRNKMDSERKSFDDERRKLMQRLKRNLH
jgi:hypothetical protein